VSAIKTYIHTNFDKCTGCSICQLACSFDLFEGYNPRLSRLAIQQKRENLYHIPVVCNQCENAYCMNVCPVKAIQRTDQGIVEIDQDRCIGCGLCAQYCPIDMILFCPEIKKAYKCDLCQGHPLCVEACPTGALELAYKKEEIEKEEKING
jgi:Fe-S-cluster-containing dehydrogenase component